MSFAVAAQDALREAMTDEKVMAEKQPGDIILTTLTEVLQDEAVRREVWDEVKWDLDDGSIADVHTVLDGLLKVLRGENE